MSTRTPLAPAALLATIAVGASLALSGCSAGSAEPSASASVTANPTPTFTDDAPSSASPTSPTEVAPRDEASPTAEAPLSTPGCEGFLTDAETTALAGEGYVPDATSTWPDVMAEAAAAGGTWCAWTAPDGSPAVHVGVVAIPDAFWQAKRGDLIAQGATEDDSQYPGFIALPDEGAPDVNGGFVYANGHLVYVSDPTLAASVSVLQ